MRMIDEKVIKKAYMNDKYIVSFRRVFQPFYSQNAGFYVSELYYARDKNLTKRGHMDFLTGQEANRLIGFELFLDL